jgi:uncharacterized integral membrane protein (TIGR00698 family)
VNESAGALRPGVAWRRAIARQRSDRRLPRLIPGLALTAAITAVASVAGEAVPMVGAPVFAIVIGIAVALVWTPTDLFKPGISFTSKQILQGSIVMLGLGLSLHRVVSVGAGSLPVLVGTLAIALGMAWLASRLLGIERDLGTLIGAGTAICGASAIAAVDAVIDAKKSDVSYAIATIFTFNVVAVLLYPSIGELLGLSQHAFGLWAGTAINDTSSVVAAASVYGHEATTYGIVVKLTRTLAIIPIGLVLGWWVRQRGGEAVARHGRRGRFSVRRTFPLFIVGFLLAVGVNTAGLIPAGWYPDIAQVAAWMITAALGAIGLSTDLSYMRRAGLRPIALGAILWATVGLASLGLQQLTGTL